MEKNADIGGVWLNCRYPGLGSHTPAFMYRFMSNPWSAKEFAHDPSENILDLDADQPSREDVLRYFAGISRHFCDRIVFGKQVVRAIYDEETSTFEVQILDSCTAASTIIRCSRLVCTIGNKFNAGKERVPRYTQESRVAHPPSTGTHERTTCCLSPWTPHRVPQT